MNQTEFYTVMSDIEGWELDPDYPRLRCNGLCPLEAVAQEVFGGNWYNDYEAAAVRLGLKQYETDIVNAADFSTTVLREQTFRTRATLSHRRRMLEAARLTEDVDA